MNWTVPKIWEDGECFIIGGGSSILRQFNIPDNIISKVVARECSPTEYSPYLSVLHNKHVIGVNMAYRLGDWIDMVFFGDKGFFLSNQEQLSQLNNLRISCTPYVREVSWVKFLDKDKKKTKGISVNKSLITWNGNSGAAAINLAIHTGVKRVFLLGFDMNVDEKERQWWHQLYKIRDLKKGKKIFSNHLSCFPAIAEDARKLGVEILNCNPDSAIKEFPKININQIL